MLPKNIQTIQADECVVNKRQAWVNERLYRDKNPVYRLFLLLIFNWLLFVDPEACSVDGPATGKRFDDIYKMESKKNRPFVKDVRFYLITGFILLFLNFLHHLTNYEATLRERTMNSLWRFIYIFPIVYMMYEHAIPAVRKKRKSIASNILIGVVLFIVFIMLFSWGSYLWRDIGISLDIYTSLMRPDISDEAIAAEQMSYSMMVVVVFGIGRHIYHHFKLRQAAQQLRIEKQQAELGYLKSQTNPHFLFNTLNNIYSLSRDKNDRAPESILRLSKILRFMLYETGGDYIAVEQELKIISDYIELEKLRYDESLRVNFNYDIEDMKQALPPLLLIPLVENAFKHGVSETRGYPFIDIHLSVRNSQLKFVVRNSSESNAGEGPVKENIGLSNLRRQLELLYTDYDVSVKQEDEVFTAVLKINLSSHV